MLTLTEYLQLIGYIISPIAAGGLLAAITVWLEHKDQDQ